MLIGRVLAIALKPALAGGTLIAAVGGGIIAYDRLGNEAPTPFQQVQSRGQQLLLSEFGRYADVIVAVDPDDPATRVEIATIDHADSYGVFPSLAPDGQAIAYTALPPDTVAPSPDSPALAGVVDVTGNATLLANDVDLLVTPVWSPDSESIVVRKNTPVENSAGSFELLLLTRDGDRSTITSWRSAAVFPIAFSRDGETLYFATLNNTGSDLYSVGPDGSAETLIAHLTDGIARDWRISPDGASIAFSEAGPGVAGVRTKVLDLATGAIADAVSSTDGARVEFNPAWRPDGELTIASVKPEGGGDAVSIDAGGTVRALSNNDDSIDLPLAWSADGAALVVRSVEGANAQSAGESALELLRDDGSRDRLSDSPDVLIVGWLE